MVYSIRIMLMTIMNDHENNHNIKRPRESSGPSIAHLLGVISPCTCEGAHHKPLSLKPHGLGFRV